MSTVQIENGRKAMLENQKRGLQPLRGSEKMCFWAESVRNGKFAHFESFIRAALARGDRASATELTQWVKRIRLENQAKYWIEARGIDAAELLWDARGVA